MHFSELNAERKKKKKKKKKKRLRWYSSRLVLEGGEDIVGFFILIV